MYHTDFFRFVKNYFAGSRHRLLGRALLAPTDSVLWNPNRALSRRVDDPVGDGIQKGLQSFFLFSDILL